jgi:hypothetical protein
MSVSYQLARAVLLGAHPEAKGPFTFGTRGSAPEGETPCIRSADFHHRPGARILFFGEAGTVTAGERHCFHDDRSDYSFMPDLLIFYVWVFLSHPVKHLYGSENYNRRQPGMVSCYGY